MNLKVWLAIAGITLIAAVAALLIWWPFNNGTLRFPGVVEIQEVRLGSKVGGRVEKVLVKEGARVTKNQPLIIFEAPELRNQKLQMLARFHQAEADALRVINGPREEEKEAAKAAAKAAKARYDRVKFGWREEEKKQAQSELDSAEADYDQSVKEFARVAQLYREKSTARSDYDAALASRDRAKGRADAARAKVLMMKIGSRPEDIAEAHGEWQRAEANYELLRNGSRSEDITLAKAKVDELKAKLDEIEINLKEATISVPEHLGDAVVEVVAVREGDLVAPNQPIIRVLRTEDLWVKIFVPETQYGLVRLDMPVDVTIDSHPGKVLKGKVIQRSNISEFTPRNVQSVDERRHQVFGVKILVEDSQGVLNAGMFAEVTFRLE